MRKLMTLFLIPVFSILRAQEYYLLVGTYDSPESQGIHVFRFNADNGKTDPVSHFKATNTSFLSVSPDERFVYTVQETASKEGTGGKLLALAFHKQSGTLSLLNEQHSWGDHPCHVETDRTGKWVFVANYSGGSLSRFPVLPDGSVGPATELKQTGSGPHPRQASSHVHGNTISPDNHWLLTTNLGTDKIMVYYLDPIEGTLYIGKHTEVASERGSGPRLSTFHPGGKFFYVIEELSGTIAMYKFKKGKLRRKQRIGTMMDGDTTFAGSADIHVSADGKFLYASNRGTANNIAIFPINKKGKLKLVGHQSTLGLAPRNFTIDPTGKYLLAANQNSNEIVLFERNIETGELKDSGQRIRIGKPVCLKWVNVSN